MKLSLRLLTIQTVIGLWEIKKKNTQVNGV